VVNTGCGARGQIPLVPATGRVTLNNEPMVNASVVFEPAAPSAGKLATGRTNDRGEFVLYTDNRRGAACGHYKAAVIPESLSNSTAGPPGVRNRDSTVPTVPASPSPSSIPFRYTSPETSGLAFDISEKDGNKLLIQLVNP